MRYGHDPDTCKRSRLKVSELRSEARKETGGGADTTAVGNICGTDHRGLSRGVRVRVLSLSQVPATPRLHHVMSPRLQRRRPHHDCC